MIYSRQYLIIIIKKSLRHELNINDLVYRLCTYFLNKKESGVSGPMHAQTRKKVIDYIRTMKICTKVIKRAS